MTSLVAWLALHLAPPKPAPPPVWQLGPGFTWSITADIKPSTLDLGGTFGVCCAVGGHRDSCSPEHWKEGRK